VARRCARRGESCTVGQVLALIKALVGGDLGVSGRLLGRTAREKSPHHGSRYTSIAFLKAVSPRAVLVSVGAVNRYRHPDPGLIGGFERAGAAVRPGAPDLDGRAGCPV
jgi:beta-lactamase superfamily II metal-dependent hydrolase